MHMMDIFHKVTNKKTVPKSLTRNYLKNSVLLHVGREIPRSHVLLHYSHVGQFLSRNQKKNCPCVRFKCKLTFAQTNHLISLSEF